jgi:RNA 2',3'-cyclic 3'-phosphodiesterase
VRAFLAVPSPHAWVASAEDLVARLRGALPNASWTKPASWHLTLVFLGEISSEQVRGFAEGMGPIARACAGGELTTSGAVIFPPRGPARVLAVGFASSAVTEALERLAREAHSVASRSIHNSQFTNHKSFHPHITLARVRRPWPRESVEAFCQEVGAWKFPAWPVRGCVLYESRLERDGAVHTPLVEWSLIESSERERA